MVRPATGFLTIDGEFYDNIETANFHEARSKLNKEFDQGLYCNTLTFQQLASILAIHSESILEYINTKNSYLMKNAETGQNDTDQEPITIES